MLVIAGLTTGTRFTAEQMYEAWNAARDLVDGYYLSISGNDRVPTPSRSCACCRFRTRRLSDPTRLRRACALLPQSELEPVPIYKE